MPARLRRPAGLARMLAPLLVLGAAGIGSATAAGGTARCASWPAWEGFKAGFVSTDGRVVDPATPRAYSTSEGQAYALFFALVAGDRAAFVTLLRWTENNLAQGDFTAHLPAWQWGQREDQSWGVVDSNPASDADLFIVYTLAEAARLWDHRPYRILSSLLARQVLQQEVRQLPGLGPTLLPAPVGFDDPQRWRLNPSYVPLMLIRGLARQQPDLPWAGLLGSSRRLVIESAPRGYAPDWALWTAGGGMATDPDTGGLGSYGAVRVYLWAGMLAPEDPDRAALLAALRPMAQQVARAGAPPRKVDTQAGQVIDPEGPSGFSAALLPFLAALGEQATLAQQSARLAQMAASDTRNYYDQVLRLFGQGWHEGQYRFRADGSLMPRWSAPCRPEPQP